MVSGEWWYCRHDSLLTSFSCRLPGQAFRPWEGHAFLEQGKRVDEAVDGFVGVVGIHLDAKNAAMVGNGGKRDGLDIKALLEEEISGVEGGFFLSDQDGNDGVLTAQDGQS